MDLTAIIELAQPNVTLRDSEYIILRNLIFTLKFISQALISCAVGNTHYYCHCVHSAAAK